MMNKQSDLMYVRMQDCEIIKGFIIPKVIVRHEAVFSLIYQSYFRKRRKTLFFTCC